MKMRQLGWEFSEQVGVWGCRGSAPDEHLVAVERRAGAVAVAPLPGRARQLPTARHGAQARMGEVAKHVASLRMGERWRFIEAKALGGRARSRHGSRVG